MWGGWASGGIPKVHYPIPHHSALQIHWRSRGYNPSQDLPSLVLDFVKLHLLMARLWCSHADGPCCSSAGATHTSQGHLSAHPPDPPMTCSFWAQVLLTPGLEPLVTAGLSP